MLFVLRMGAMILDVSHGEDDCGVGTKAGDGLLDLDGEQNNSSKSPPVNDSSTRYFLRQRSPSTYLLKHLDQL